MIKFFRKIRQSALSQSLSAGHKAGKTSKPAARAAQYLLYATGEIILVVIGILIALQINNWNEYRKTQIQQRNLLASVQNSLQKSVDNIGNVIKQNQNTLVSYRMILDHMESGNPYNDTLGYHLALITNWWSPFLDQSAFETLKNKGSEFVNNEKLRESIIEVFEQDFVTFVNDLDRAEWDTSASVVRPFFVKHFRTISHSPRKVEPNDYESLRQNDEFKNMVTYIMQLRTMGIQEGHRILVKIEKLLADISQELNLNTK